MTQTHRRPDQEKLVLASYCALRDLQMLLTMDWIPDNVRMTEMTGSTQ